MGEFGSESFTTSFVGCISPSLMIIVIDRVGQLFAGKCAFGEHDFICSFVIVAIKRLLMLDKLFTAVIVLCSKSRRRSKSRACSNHKVRKPGVWSSQQGWSPSKGCPKEDRSHRLPSTSSHSYKQTRSSGHATHLAPSKEELLKFLKLKEEVVKRPQGYIQGCAKHISRTLSPNHDAVKCLMVFGENALKYAVEVLATIEWGTQHWKLQEPFPVPLVPRLLRMPELIQTRTPLRGELLLIPLGTHLEDIHIHSPALWVWMAILLQYWQDHMTRHLYGGRFRRASELASTLIRDINPWLPHRVHFGWSYVATHATLWLDMQDQFAGEHHT